MCELPNAGMNMEVKYITGTMDAEVTCYDGVIEPGTISYTAFLRGNYPKYTREFGLGLGYLNSKSIVQKNSFIFTNIHHGTLLTITS